MFLQVGDWTIQYQQHIDNNNDNDNKHRTKTVRHRPNYKRQEEREKKERKVIALISWVRLLNCILRAGALVKQKTKTKIIIKRVGTIKKVKERII